MNINESWKIAKGVNYMCTIQMWGCNYNKKTIDDDRLCGYLELTLIYSKVSQNSYKDT